MLRLPHDAIQMCLHCSRRWAASTESATVSIGRIASVQRAMAEGREVSRQKGFRRGRFGEEYLSWPSAQGGVSQMRTTSGLLTRWPGRGHQGQLPAKPPGRNRVHGGASHVTRSGYSCGGTAARNHYRNYGDHRTTGVRYINTRLATTSPS